MTRGPWSVKGIDPKARAAARERAQREGVTLGVYLNRLLLEEEDEAIYAPGLVSTADVVSGEIEDIQRVADAVDDLARRLEVSEKRSSSALAGVDTSLINLVNRIESAEGGNRETLGRFAKNLEELRKTQSAMQTQLKRGPQSDNSKQALDAMKDLEGALSRLVAQVHDRQKTNETRQEEFLSEVEANFSRVDDDVVLLRSQLQTSNAKFDDALGRLSGAAERMEAFEVNTDAAINRALGRLDDAAQNAAPNKNLADKLFGRVDAVETNLQSSHANLTSMMGRVSDVSSRIERIENKTERAANTLESTVDRINDRLVRAEQSTDAAIKTLESSFTSVDARLAEMQRKVSETSDLRETFQRRFDGFTEDMARALADTRSEMNQRINEASLKARPEAVDKLDVALGQLQSRLNQSEERQAQIVETVSEQLTRMSSALDQRLKAVETREDAVDADALRREIADLSKEIEARLAAVETRGADAIGAVGEEVGKLADRLEARVRNNERQTADAIETVGGQVSRVADRLEARQDEAIQDLSKQLDDAKADTSSRLSDALAGMTRRFDEILENADGSVDPMRATVSSMAKRIELLENGASPPPPYDEPPFDEPPGELEFDAEAAPHDDVAPFPESDAETETEDLASLADLEAELGLADSSDEDLPGELDDFSDFDPIEDLLAEGLGDDDEEALETGELDSEAAPAIADTAEDDHPAHERRPSLSAPQSAALEFEFEAPQPDADTPLRSDQGRDDDPFDRLASPNTAAASDYLVAARRAALENSQAPRSGAAHSGKRGGKLPMMAASALAIAVAGGGAVAMMRGKQEPSTDVFSAAATSTDVRAAPSLETAEFPDDGLFEDDPADVLFADPTAQIDQANDVDKAVDETLLFPETEGVDVGNVAITSPTLAQTDAEAAAFQPIEPAELTRPASLEDAAAGGDLRAIYELALKDLENGEKARGAEQLRRAANRGLTIAQYRLAKLYERGEGVARSVAESRKWTEQAASAGNVKAMHDLAVFYAEGDGGPQSYAAAASWFLKAADAGLVDSQYNAGVLFEQGLGVTQNLAEAAFWYEIAGRAGDPDGARRALELSRETPGLDYEGVIQRASEFRPSDMDDRANGRFGEPAWEQASASEIRDVQRILSRLGFDPGPADGAMGARTRRAITAFERSAGLKTTGRVTPQLINELNAAARAISG